MKILFYFVVMNLFSNCASDEKEVDTTKPGRLVKKGQYPFFVQIAVGTSIRKSSVTDRDKSEVTGYSCGGTLIHPFWVLTAARCFKREKLLQFFFRNNDIIALMGTEDIDDFTNPDQVRFIAKVYIHPCYDYQEMVFDVSVQFNVALALLKTPFVLNDFIQTIRLPDYATRLCPCGVVIGKKVTKANDKDESCSELVRYNNLHPKCITDVTEPPIYQAKKVFYTESRWYRDSPLVGEVGGPFICYEEYEPIQYGIISTYYNNTKNRTAITIYENVKSHIRFIKRWVPLKPAYKFVKMHSNENKRSSNYLLYNYYIH